MNSEDLYPALMKLCNDPANDNAFYYKDFPVTGEYHTGEISDMFVYRIFNYRLATHTMFLQEGAKWCRGTMYLVNTLSYDVKLVCRTMEKFWNLHEGMNEHLDIEDLIRDADVVMDKLDGSLISSYLDINEKLKLKSKGSLSSEQAIDAMQFLAESTTDLYEMLFVAAMQGWTVNMELTSPKNRIVVGYDKTELRVLNAINNETGEYMDQGALQKLLAPYVVDVIEDSSQIRTYRTQKGNEGYVVRLVDGTHVKLKTDEYISLHRNKDSINSAKHLFEACIDECTDDLKQMFTDDAAALATIVAMEAVAAHAYNGLVSNVSLFHGVHKHMQRKEYALLARDVLRPMEFACAMQAFVGKEVDYKRIIKKNYRLFIEG